VPPLQRNLPFFVSPPGGLCRGSRIALSRASRWEPRRAMAVRSAMHRDGARDVDEVAGNNGRRRFPQRATRSSTGLLAARAHAARAHHASGWNQYKASVSSEIAK